MEKFVCTAPRRRRRINRFLFNYTQSLSLFHRLSPSKELVSQTITNTAHPLSP